MKRNYGIDLLRLVLMYMVVLVHILGTGGVVWTAPLFSGQYWAAWSLDALCYCSVNSFALITGYVHYGTKYKVSSILSLTAQAFFYSASITLLCALFQPDRITSREIVNALFPIHRVSWWYVSAYGGLFLLIPVLEAGAKAFTQRQSIAFSAAAFAAFSVMPTFLVSDPFMMYYGYSTLWLAYLYLIGAFIKKFGWCVHASAGRLFAAFFGLVGITALSKFLIEAVTIRLLGQSQFSTILLSYTSPTIVAASAALLMAFARLELSPGVTRVVRTFSPAAFGVYLIHCHPLIFERLSGRFGPLVSRGPLTMTVLLLLAALAIYLSCLIVDYLRILLFRRLRIREHLDRVADRMTAWFRESPEKPHDPPKI